jgi:hypothetical protein
VKTCRTPRYFLTALAIYLTPDIITLVQHALKMCLSDPGHVGRMRHFQRCQLSQARALGHGSLPSFRFQLLIIILSLRRWRLWGFLNPSVSVTSQIE